MLRGMATTLTRTIELSPKTVDRLHSVATLVGGDARLIAQEGIERFLDDLEDYRVAAERYRNHVPGSGTSLEALIEKYGLGD